MEEFLDRCFYQAVRGYRSRACCAAAVGMQWGACAARQSSKQWGVVARPAAALLHPYCYSYTTVPTNHRLQGQYASDDDFSALDARLRQTEGSLKKADRLFYLSIPPNIFTAVAACASKSASSKCAMHAMHGRAAGQQC